MDDEETRCGCGVNVVRRTCGNGGINDGREFIACAKDRRVDNTHCGFFKWLGDPPASAGLPKKRKFESSDDGLAMKVASLEDKMDKILVAYEELANVLVAIDVKLTALSK